MAHTLNENVRAIRSAARRLRRARTSGGDTRLTMELMHRCMEVRDHPDAAPADKQLAQSLLMAKAHNIK